MKYQRDMYKWLIICCMLLIPFVVVRSQEMQISSPVKMTSKLADFEILGKNQSGLYVHYYSNSKSEIELFNNQLRPVIKKEVALKDKNARLESILLREKGGVVFYSHNVYGKQYLKARWLTDYLETSSKVVVLDSMDKSKNYGFDPFYIKQSVNLQYFVVFSIFEERNKLAVKYQILNSELEQIDNGTFENLQKDVVLKSFKINNNGIIYAVMARQMRNSSLGDYLYDDIYTFIYDPHTKKGTQQKSKNEGFRFKNIVTEIDNKTDRAYTVANYRSQENTDDLGMVMMSTESNSSENFQYRYPYTRDAMATLHSYEAKDWKDQAMIIRPKRIIPQSDGGCLVISEGQYQYTRVVRSNPYAYPSMYGDVYTRVYDQNHYFDISTVSIDGKGNINWNIVMPKMQMTEGDGGMYSSFIMYESNNLLKFLFNEDIYSNGNFVEYNLNPAGVTKRVSVLNTEKDALILIPQKGMQISETEIVIPSEQKRNLQLVLFKY